MTVALEWGTLKARLRAAHRGELLGALRPPATADERLTIERTVGRPLGELAELLALSSGTDAPTDRPWDPYMLFPPQILLGVPEALAELENPDTVTVTGDYPVLGAVDNVFLCQTSSGEIVLCDPAEERMTVFVSIESMLRSLSAMYAAGHWAAGSECSTDWERVREIGAVHEPLAPYWRRDR